jgi:hypothetical protein
MVDKQEFYSKMILTLGIGRTFPVNSLKRFIKMTKVVKSTFIRDFKKLIGFSANSFEA